MNITMQNVDKVNALLSVKIEKADYEEGLNKALKNFQKKAQLRGFRVGHTPMSLIVKMYGPEAKTEEVYKVLDEKLNAYLKEQNINTLIEPMISEKQQPLNFETSDDYEFLFDLALEPEFSAELTDKDEIPYYDIQVTDKIIDERVKMLAQRAGSYEQVDSFQEKCMLKGLLAELDENGQPLEGGLQVESASLMPDYFANDDQKKIFADSKVNDVITFNPSVAYEGRNSEIAALMKIKTEEIDAHKGQFSFQVNEISTFKPAEVNQDLFDQAFGKGNVKDEADFRAKIKEGLEKEYEADSDYKFMLDVRAHLAEKAGKVEFPEAALKRFLKEKNKDKDAEYVDKNFDGIINDLQWQLSQNKLAKACQIKIEDADLKEAAMQATRMQFAQYGMSNIPDNILENYASEMLKKQDQVNQLFTRALEAKLGAALKAVVKLNHKEISVEDFNKMFEEK